MNKVPVDDLLKGMEAYGQGVQTGRELAIKKYDKLFLELYQKMESIEDKIDKLLFVFHQSQEGKEGVSQ